MSPQMPGMPPLPTRKHASQMPHFRGYVASDYPRFWALNRGAGRDQDHDSHLPAVLMKRGTERTKRLARKSQSVRNDA
jgi:hypothetical protein